jgi:hypothetical protein
MKIGSGHFLSAAMLILSLTTAVSGATTRPQLSATQRVDRSDAAGGEVVLSDLPDISAQELAGVKEVPSPRNPHFSGQLPTGTAVALPQGAAHVLVPRSGAQDVEQGTPGAFADFTGALQGCNGVGWTPSDMGLAVSSGYIVQVVNECVTVWKNAAGYALLVGPKDLCGIFGLPANSGTHGCFDPRVLYDAQANKFVISASYQDTNSNGWILIASATNPTLAWIHHSISRGAALADYPTLGQTAYLNNANNSVITVCDNLFGNNGSFTDECLFLPKTRVYSTLSLGVFPVWSNFTLGGVLQNTMQPVNSYELTDNPRAQYVINSVNDNGGICNGAGGGESGLVIWAFSGNTAGQSHASGSFTGCRSTATYSFPGAADDAGFCSHCIPTLDNRINSMAFYSAGEIFATINAFNGYSSAALGWKLHPFLDDNGQGCTGGVLCPNITSVSIGQQFCYDCGAGQGAQAYYGAIAPTEENDWTMFAEFSNNTLSPGMFYTSNNVSWASPFHDGGTFACQNNASYGQGRWGDYNAASPDEPGTNPKNVAATWGSGMYVQPSGSWGTCIAGNHPETP